MTGPLRPGIKAVNNQLKTLLEMANESIFVITLCTRVIHLFLYTPIELASGGRRLDIQEIAFC